MRSHERSRLLTPHASAECAVTHLGPAVVTTAEKVSGLFSPFTLFDGVRMWLGGTDLADGVPNPGGFGVVYALVLVFILALCLFGLAARYRKARLS